MNFPIPSPERIREIAQWLPATPGHFGPAADDRQAWLPFADTPAARAVIANAEKAATTPTPVLPDELYLQFVNNGNRTNYEAIYFDRIRNRLFSLVQAEVLEYKGRFLPAIERELDALFHEKSWVLPAHDADLTNFNQTALYADLFCSEVCSDLAIYDWWLQDKLAPQTRATIRSEVQRRMFDAYQSVIRTGHIVYGQWWTVGDNNWNAVCHAQLAIAAMLLLPDPLQRAEILAGAEQGLPFFISGYAPDGYCTEGVGYWGYGYGRFLVLAELALMMTGGKLNFYDNQVLHNVAAYARDIQIEENCSPAFADCGLKASISPIYPGIIQQRYPDAVLRAIPPQQEITDTPMMTILRCFYCPDPKSLNIPADGQLPSRSFFPDGGIYIGRSVSADGTRFGAAIKAGHNAEQHNHNDIGSFVVVRNGHQFFIDPGSEVYTKKTFSPQRYEEEMLNSYGHQVPKVADVLQSPGRAAKGTIVRTTFTADTDTLIIDLKPAYPQAPDLVKLQRTMTFNRREQSLVIRDDVTFASPQTFETALVSYDPLEQRGLDTVVAACEGQQVTATIAVEGGDYSLQQSAINNPNKTNPTRLAIRLNAPVTQAAITVRFA